MSDKAKAVVLAEEKLAVVEAQSASFYETQMATRKVLEENVAAAKTRAAEAENAYAAAQEQATSL